MLNRALRNISLIKNTEPLLCMKLRNCGALSLSISLSVCVCNTRMDQVGFFRRSRTIKGKRAPPACKEVRIIQDQISLKLREWISNFLPI